MDEADPADAALAGCGFQIQEHSQLQGNVQKLEPKTSVLKILYTLSSQKVPGYPSATAGGVWGHLHRQRAQVWNDLLRTRGICKSVLLLNYMLLLVYHLIVLCNSLYPV